MSKFKIGDQVRLTRASLRFNATYSGTLHVLYVSPSNHVAVGDTPTLGMSHALWFAPDELELVQEYTSQQLLLANKYNAANSPVSVVLPRRLLAYSDFEFYADNRVWQKYPPLSDEYKHFEEKCECGAESLGYNTHSTWCQKHEE